MDDTLFKTSDGRHWHVALTCGRAAEIREAIGLDVETEEGLAGMYQLTGSQISAALWCCLRQVADTWGIDRQAFMNSMDADAVADGWRALMRALVNFIPPQQRQKAEAILEAQEKLHAAILGEYRRRLPELEFNAEVARQMDKIVAETFPSPN